MMRIKNNLKIKRGLWCAVLLFAVNALFSTPSSGVVNIPVVLSNGIISVEVQESHDSSPADGKTEFGHRRLNVGDVAYRKSDGTISKDSNGGVLAAGIIIYIFKVEDTFKLHNYLLGEYVYDPTVQHGLMMALGDIPAIYSSPGVSGLSLATSTGNLPMYPDQESVDNHPIKCAIGTGWKNTSILRTDLRDSAYVEYTAAYACDLYHSSGYSDWFVPSKDEMNEMFKVDELIKNGTIVIPPGIYSSFRAASYGSSSESSGNYYWTLDANTGGWLQDNRKTVPAYIRQLRAF